MNIQSGEFQVTISASIGPDETTSKAAPSTILTKPAEQSELDAIASIKSNSPTSMLEKMTNLVRIYPDTDKKADLT